MNQPRAQRGSEERFVDLSIFMDQSIFYKSSCLIAQSGEGKGPLIFINQNISKLEGPSFIFDDFRIFYRTIRKIFGREAKPKSKNRDTNKPQHLIIFSKARHFHDWMEFNLQGCK